jgi:hypothetical protein
LTTDMARWIESGPGGTRCACPGPTFPHRPSRSGSDEPRDIPLTCIVLDATVILCASWRCRPDLGFWRGATPLYRAHVDSDRKRLWHKDRDAAICGYGEFRNPVLAVRQQAAHGCGRFVKILLDQELIITSGCEVLVQHSLAGKEACCFRLFLPLPLTSRIRSACMPAGPRDVESAVHHRRVRRPRRRRG